MFQPPPFHSRRRDLVAPVGVDPNGSLGPTRGQVRGRHWRRTSYGYFVPASCSVDDPDQRIVEAAPLLREHCRARDRVQDAVTGWAALRWRNGRWFEGAGSDGRRLEVPIVATHYVAPQPGFLVSQEHLRPGEVEVVDGLPVTTAVRSVCFEMRHATSAWLAVAALDMAAYSDLTSVAETKAYADTLATWTGIPQCRAALLLADENSWSPMEVLMRKVWTHDGARPRPLCNVPVFDRWGRHVGTPDLLDPVAGVFGEYDSALHLVGSQRTKDVRREGAFRALGLEGATMLGSDRTDGFRSFLSRLDTAYRNARFAAEAARPWSLVPPRWWIDTTTVEARRNLPPHLRERLLRHRRAA